MAPMPTSKELAREALEALKSEQMTSSEHFELLVRKGIIDRKGRVLVAKLFGDQAELKRARHCAGFVTEWVVILFRHPPFRRT
jgi:hypothetical protein